MSVIGHILRVPTTVTHEASDGVRWCFYCRKRVEFTFRVHTPTDPESWYGPNRTVSCEKGHHDGDCFPGTWREWSEYVEGDR